MTDFRALCAELLASYEDTFVISEPSDDPLVQQARAALAQPEPQGPTDEELVELFNENDWNYVSPETFIDIARTVLEGWGRTAIEPVPVTERLPGPEDCDAEGKCWLLTVEDDYPQWRLHSIQGAQPSGYMIWVPVDSDGAMVDCFYASHWLPHHALPVLQQEAE
jgi:hypothetical protein